MLSVYNSAAKFVAKLHSFNNLSRSDVNNIRYFVETLILNPVVQFIEQSQNPYNNSNKSLINVLKDVTMLFEGVNTESKLNKVLQERDLIGNVHSFQINNNAKSNGIVMPLEFQFKKIFEHDDFIDKVLEHMEFIQSNDKFINYIQGPLWRQKKSLYPHEIVIPFYLYADDFGINNPLGSKSNKNSICNFYYSFACIPKKSSKLDDIYLASTVKSSDVKTYGNDCFKPLVDTLVKLEKEGILIKTKNGTKKIHFVMALFLGDNLGLNCILGFSKSFSANYYCRFCLIKKSEAQVESTERNNILRNRINYRESLEQGLMAETGVSTTCIFNDIPSFHCVENYSVDIMHDIFEGVCHYVICEALLYFIKTMKYFSLNDLNERLKSFKYYQHDRGNEKYSITFQELDNHKLKMSAHQMMCFYQYFTVMLGEFIMNQDPVWIFILDFFEIIDEILCYDVSQSLINRLKVKIQNFNKNYQLIFKQHLTPKFHNLFPPQLKISTDENGAKYKKKFTIADSQESFAVVASTMDELETKLKLLKLQGRKIQPKLLVIGDTLKVKQIFVYFDNLRYPFVSTLKAFDVLFKIFFVFNLEYPSESEIFYHFIQSLFYDLPTSKKFIKSNIIKHEILKMKN
ncbi:uncharacterized protein LOC124419499 [Lucilia cuprina]|uniref:uncharacterized protein LOC124419499 n=1 Tax=Lucilia cuprina TaxID=7375 RepID=UPI001F06B1B6|nr:uncharacterized protein LOC124419499 [Lucilia cuprina]XP_046805209.1 uncharacterized protein LOC124419499 [Lucilia cuprina]XP_046805210.1 uncharacterized protein LOC124419499 [Lucilia cuprina]XP_046805211.1 uncharacterized protein LOC124419499 [Lucilia cuprina]XP_046805212.1 uncharacterized protein LOC124419499 [Lucilia cuprina]XP_046805213.1 uncharacterized protein LOC124419499 [Lucilia cuprina]